MRIYHKVQSLSDIKNTLVRAAALAARLAVLSSRLKVGFVGNTGLVASPESTFDCTWL